MNAEPMPFDAKFLLTWLAMISTGIIVAFIGLSVVGAIAFKKQDPSMAEKFVELFGRGDMVRLITAVTIVIAVTALAFGGVLSGEVTGTLLSGVAGYVLGGISARRQSKGKDGKADDA
jgi:predicted neutral ceramidase superfamily lipid hydrolase